jgi:hypothetical protein
MARLDGPRLNLWASPWLSPSARNIAHMAGKSLISTMGTASSQRRHKIGLIKLIDHGGGLKSPQMIMWWNESQR